MKDVREEIRRILEDLGWRALVSEIGSVVQKQLAVVYAPGQLLCVAIFFNITLADSSGKLSPASKTFSSNFAVHVPSYEELSVKEQVDAIARMMRLAVVQLSENVKANKEVRLGEITELPLCVV